ncbi:MAG: hypothetical protein WC471_02025 [Candidatus Woesearchaeota archaeon]
MIKSLKEELIFKTRLQELELMDKDFSFVFYKLITGGLAIYVFIYYTNILGSLSLKWLLTTGFLYIMGMCWFIYNQNNYLSDNYTGLCRAVEVNKLFSFRFHKLTFKEGFYYRKRY